MPKIVITNVPGLDGEYDLDMNFTYRDFRTLKEVAGVRANEMMDALNAGDLDIILALAEIALRRAAVVHTLDMLLDADTGAVTLDVSDMEVDDASPPPSAGDGSENSDERPLSGPDTNGATEPSQETSTADSSGTPQLVST